MSLPLTFEQRLCNNLKANFSELSRIVEKTIREHQNEIIPEDNMIMITAYKNDLVHHIEDCIQKNIKDGTASDAEYLLQQVYDISSKITNHNNRLLALSVRGGKTNRRKKGRKSKRTKRTNRTKRNNK